MTWIRIKKVWKSIKILLNVTFGLGLLFLFFVGYFYFHLRVGLPRSGEGALIPDLKLPVIIAQDRLGIPSVESEDWGDLYRGQGWVVARDRFFQMDLLRRRSSGRLAEIFGSAALEVDRLHRQLGFQQLAEEAYQKMSPATRMPLESYAQGVNAFLKKGRLPFEFGVLGFQPEPWKPSDSLLVVLAMYEDLDFDFLRASEESQTYLYRKRPRALADFLTPVFGMLDLSILPESSRPLNPKIPPDSVFDMRLEKQMEPTHSLLQKSSMLEPPVYGSNGWVLSGSRTQSGFPIVAGDPHLALSVPNIWYRVQLKSLKAPQLTLRGVALPGFPGIIIGTNGKMAWTFTNVLADTLDLIPLELSEDEKHYAVGSQMEAFEIREETIKVRGADSQIEKVRQTRWGPVLPDRLAEDPTKASVSPKSFVAVQWVALDSENLSRLSSHGLNNATEFNDFLRALKDWGGPVQNILFASKTGETGWRVVGKIPRRVGFDGRVYQTRDSGHDWRGYLPDHQLPRLLNPPSGMIVSANQRSVPAHSKVYRIGSNFASPARAFRIWSLLDQREKWNVDSIRKVQLDTVSLQARWYRDRLAGVLRNPQVIVKQDKDALLWIQKINMLLDLEKDLQAVPESKLYPYIRVFAVKLHEALLDPLWGTVQPEKKKKTQNYRDKTAGRSYMKGLSNYRERWFNTLPVMEKLLREKPPHLLSARYPSYEQAIVESAVAAAQEWVSRPVDFGGVDSPTWGDLNRAHIVHPFSLGQTPPLLGSIINMPDAPLAGDWDSPRVCRPWYGASMRMVIDLEDPASSLFQHAGGQSGHPLSENYADQFEAWVQGLPRAFEIGPTTRVDLLHP